MSNTANTYPNLEHLLSCYFYQDYESEYGDVATALEAYCLETAIEYRMATANEIRTLLASGASLADVIGSLGGGNVKVKDLKEWITSVATRLEK